MKPKSNEFIHAALIKDRNGEYEPILYNIFIVLTHHKEWIGVFDFMVRGEKFIPMKNICPPYPTPEELGVWLHEDNVLTSMWLQRYGILVTPEQVNDAVRVIALIGHNLIEGIHEGVDVFEGAF